MNEYTIEELEKTFKEHSEKAFREFELQCIKYFKEFQQPHPNVDTFFDISKALHVICKEIKEIKDRTSGVSRIEKTGIRFEA